MVKVPYSGKLSREKTIANLKKIRFFAEKTFADCSLLLCQRMPRPKFCGENFRIEPQNREIRKSFSLESFLLYGNLQFFYSVAKVAELWKLSSILSA